MKWTLLALVVTFVAAMIFHGQGNKNLMGFFSLAFCASGIYLLYQIIVLLKRKTVEQVKKGVSATAYGKKNDLRDLIRNRVFNSDISDLQEEIQSYAREKKMNDVAVKEAVLRSIPLVIEDALNDGILTGEEQARIDNFLQAYSLSADDIAQRGKELLVRGALIRDLLEGNVKPRVDISAIPYKAMKGEIPIWGYSNMAVAEVRNVSRFEGGSQGVSIRVMKGVYWRVGKMAAQRVTSEEIKDIGTGTVLITSHHLYYHAGNTSKRIKHGKIFNIVPLSDAVIVHMDGASAKPLVLKTDDSWFLANILQNAQNWT